MYEDPNALYRRSAGSDCGVDHVRVFDVTARENVIEPLTAESLAALREMLPHVHVTGRCLEALLNEIDALRLRTSQEWVDARERLPPNSMDAVYYVATRITNGGQSQTACSERCFFNDNWWPVPRSYEHVYAWFVLPPPPKGEAP